MKIRYAVCSVRGNYRSENQDNYYVNGLIRPLQQRDVFKVGIIDQPQTCFAVCDGMGGHEAGEIASYLAVDKMKNLDISDYSSNWKNYIYDINSSILEYATFHNLVMGSTFAGIFVNNKSINAINIGDTRIYRVKNHVLEQISIDDTEFRVLVEAGVLTPDCFQNSIAKNQLTQYLGIDTNEISIEPHVYTINNPCDREIYVICSDGLFDVIPVNRMSELLTMDEPLATICEALVQEAINMKSRDNITVLMIDIM